MKTLTNYVGSALLIAITAISGNVFANDAGAQAIGVRDTNNSCNSSSECQDPNLTVTPVKRSYKAGQAIFFKVKASEDAYLYAFTPDKNGEAMIIWPAEKNFNNQTKLKKNKTYKVPADGIEFFSDTPNTTEEIVFVVTREKQNLSKLKRQSFGSMSMASTKDIASSFDDESTSVKIKAIRTRETAPEQDTSVSELANNIKVVAIKIK